MNGIESSLRPQRLPRWVEMPNGYDHRMRLHYTPFPRQLAVHRYQCIQVAHTIRMSCRKRMVITQCPLGHSAACLGHLLWSGSDWMPGVSLPRFSTLQLSSTRPNITDYLKLTREITPYANSIPTEPAEILDGYMKFVQATVF